MLRSGVNALREKRMNKIFKILLKIAVRSLHGKFLKNGVFSLLFCFF